MKKFKTLKHMNRPVRFWGLTPMQFTIMVIGLAMIVIVLIFKKVNIIIMFTSILGMVFGFTSIFKKLKEEQKKGNTNYLQGIMVKDKTPKKIIDDGIFKNIMKNGNNNSYK